MRRFSLMQHRAHVLGMLMAAVLFAVGCDSPESTTQPDTEMRDTLTGDDLGDTLDVHGDADLRDTLDSDVGEDQPDQSSDLELDEIDDTPTDDTLSDTQIDDVPADEIDPTCLIDTDADGIVNCDDDDDDNDGLSDDDEGSYGTDPLVEDSDRDGLSDGLEVNTQWSFTDFSGGGPASAVKPSDPTVPTLLVEIDPMQGHSPASGPGTIFTLARNAFGDIGIEVYFWVDQPVVTLESPLTDPLRKESILLNADNAATDATFGYYTHVVFAAVGSGNQHGTTHYAVANDPSQGNHGNNPDPRLSGAFIFTDTIGADFTSNASTFNTLGVTLDHLIARTLVHEIGHLLGCTHEGLAGGGYDATNVMIQNSDLGNPSGALSAWSSATALGYPTFSSDAARQMSLELKVSVDVATSLIDRRFDAGTSTSPIQRGSVQVTHETDFDPWLGYGFLPPYPAVSSAQGSDPSDPRWSDYVAGDPSLELSTRFAMSATGTFPVDVFLRLGANSPDELRVRCELVHPIHGTAFLFGTLQSGGDSIRTSPPVLVNPLATPSALGYDHTRVVLECLDDELRDDAPIEEVTLLKRKP